MFMIGLGGIGLWLGLNIGRQGNNGSGRLPTGDYSAADYSPLDYRTV